MARPHPALPAKGINAEPEAAKRRAALARLHVAKKERGLDDDIWRDVIERVTGKRSLKELGVRQLYDLLDEVVGKGTRTPAPRGAMSGPYAAKLRALWLSGWHLGVIRDRSDAALVHFVQRQTGLDAVRFLHDAKDARAAIEALKSWLARTAGVEWSAYPDNPRAAVAEAQWRLAQLHDAIGAHVPPERWNDAQYQYARTVTGKTAPNHYTEEDWDKLIAALGGRLRAALAAKGTTEL